MLVHKDVLFFKFYEDGGPTGGGGGGALWYFIHTYARVIFWVHNFELKYF